ncbi:MAPEG family protein [Devosia albogilva]|uniref:MAPEG family protein n=1 Tax=Devosia albogilva TaxID=429726 RepID=A0ABW5QIX9_9HYPH
MSGGPANLSTVAASRRRMLVSAIVVVPPAILVWLGLYHYSPEPVSFADPAGRLGFAFGWIAVATLLTLVSGIEAVAHERLFTPAIDPLAGAESRRLKINLRFLQNTLEQLAIFAPGLLLLAWYAADTAELRAVTATAIVWIALRFVFWVGYHRSHELRTPGILGLVLSMSVLLLGTAHFGYEFGGWPGAVLPIAIFGGIEAYLVLVAVRAGREQL